MQQGPPHCSQSSCCSSPQGKGMEASPKPSPAHPLPPYPVFFLELQDMVLQPLLPLVPLQVLDEGCLLLAELLERADIEVQPFYLLLVLLLLLPQLTRQQPAHMHSGKLRHQPPSAPTHHLLRRLPRRYFSPEAQELVQGTLGAAWTQLC